jgi:phosphomannomutase
MAPKFGTSGLRGLVTELTPPLVAAHVRAFLAACPAGSGLWVGRDLRASSPGLAAVVADTARAEGLDVTDCGALPTPALAMAAGAAGAAAVMVTGSHIPADRNGLKFYTPAGEITKADEAAILARLDRPAGTGRGALAVNGTAAADWRARARAFGADALAGMRVGVWEHSSVARDLLAGALADAGAAVVPLGRSEAFVPVDTEAVGPEVREMLAGWVRDHALDALVSADGDADRPLLADGAGQLVPGDVLGQITAAALGAQTVVCPVSANSGADLGGRFARVIRTRIGSPFVIAAMQAARAGGAGRVAGYEPNGGFLLGFAARAPGGTLAPLMTRDCLLPLVAVLAEARRAGGVAARVAQEPARFTATDRVEHVPVARSQAFLAGLDAPGGLAGFLAGLGEVGAGAGAGAGAGQDRPIDRTDGLRVALASGRVLHLRPSGNAPEFRVYAEAESRAAAVALLGRGLAAVAAALA